MAKLNIGVSRKSADITNLVRMGKDLFILTLVRKGCPSELLCEIEMTEAEAKKMAELFSAAVKE
jgi:hypothetical protein